MKSKIVLQTIKYLCLTLYLYALGCLRWIIVLIFIAFLIYDIMKKYKFMIVQDAIIIIITFAIMLTPHFLFKQADYLRFYTLRNVYDSTANEILYEIQGEDDVYWSEYHTGGLWPITVDGTILYMKQKDSAVILFPIDKGNMAGYVYFFDAESKRMFETPSEFFPKHTQVDNIYEFYRTLTDDWSYVHFY